MTTEIISFTSEADRIFKVKALEARGRNWHIINSNRDNFVATDVSDVEPPKRKLTKQQIDDEQREEYKEKNNIEEIL